MQILLGRLFESNTKSLSTILLPLGIRFLGKKGFEPVEIIIFSDEIFISFPASLMLTSLGVLNEAKP